MASTIWMTLSKVSNIVVLTNIHMGPLKVTTGHLVFVRMDGWMDGCNEWMELMEYEYKMNHRDQH